MDVNGSMNELVLTKKGNKETAKHTQFLSLQGTRGRRPIIF